MSLLKCKAGDILVDEQTLELTILGNPDSLLDDTEKYIYYRLLNNDDYIINKQSLNILKYSNDIKTAIRRHLPDFRLANEEEIELFKSGKEIEAYIRIGEGICKKCSTIKEQNETKKFTESEAVKNLKNTINTHNSAIVSFAYCTKCLTFTMHELISINFKNTHTNELLTSKIYENSTGN